MSPRPGHRYREYPAHQPQGSDDWPAGPRLHAFKERQCGLWVVLATERETCTPSVQYIPSTP